MRAPLTCVSDRETAPGPARYLNRAPLACRPAREKLREHPIGYVTQFEAVGIAEHQGERDHGPDHGGSERVGKLLAVQHKGDHGDQCERHDLRLDVGIVPPHELVPCGIIVSQQEGAQDEREDS